MGSLWWGPCLATPGHLPRPREGLAGRSPSSRPDPTLWARSSCWPRLATRPASRPRRVAGSAQAHIQLADGAEVRCSDREPIGPALGAGVVSGPASLEWPRARPRHGRWRRPGAPPLRPLRGRTKGTKSRSQPSGRGLWVGKVGVNEQGHGVARRPRSGGDGPISAGAPMGGRRPWLTPRWSKPTMPMP